MNNLVFVFGSNLAGRHGKGAAKYAMKNWGAVYGVGEGRTGNSYAIPTKDEKLKVLSLDRIHSAIHSFLQYADEHPDEYFIFTPVGTGLAGYSVNDIMLGIDADRLPPNVLFTSTWFKEL